VPQFENLKIQNYDTYVFTIEQIYPAFWRNYCPNRNQAPLEHERFMELCRLVTDEQEPEKLAARIREIIALLDSKYQPLARMHLIDRAN
jgi:hypothetical protein